MSTETLRPGTTSLQYEAARSSAFNSYAKHCKDPVAAAESDLLGQLRDTMTDLLAAIEFQNKAPSIPHREHLDSKVKWARALLAETKEGA